MFYLYVRLLRNILLLYIKNKINIHLTAKLYFLMASGILFCMVAAAFMKHVLPFVIPYVVIVTVVSDSA